MIGSGGQYCAIPGAPPPDSQLGARHGGCRTNLLHHVPQQPLKGIEVGVLEPAVVQLEALHEEPVGTTVVVVVNVTVTMTTTTTISAMGGKRTAVAGGAPPPRPAPARTLTPPNPAPAQRVVVVNGGLVRAPLVDERPARVHELEG